MRILICDESKDFVESWERRIQKYLVNEKNVMIDRCTSVEEVDYQLRTKSYDIAFLDAEIHGYCGLQLVSRLRRKNKLVSVFCITNHMNYIYMAFQLRIFQYMIKDVSDEVLERELKRAIKDYKREKAKCILHIQDKSLVFLPEEIIYIDTRNRKLKMVTTLGEYEGTVDNLEKMKEELEFFDFCQVHQSYFINMNAIVSMQKGKVVLNNGDILPTSIMHKDAIDKRIEMFLKSE